MTETIEVPQQADTVEVAAITNNALRISEQYDEYKVTTADEYQNGAEHLKGIKSALTQVEDERFKITRPQDAAKAAVMSFFAQFTTRLKSAESIVKRELLVYSNEQDRIAREERRKQDERDRKAQEKLDLAAKEAREKGNEARADILEDRAESLATAPSLPTPPPAPKVAGISTRSVWKFELTDPGKVPREYMTVDEKKIGAIVRALKGDTNIPGVRVYSEKVMSAGRG